MELVAGMGGYAVSNNQDDIIRTFALASCVAITVYSPLKKAAGMIHVVLPAPLAAKDRQQRPGYFAETGIPLLIDTMNRRFGCTKQELHVQMYGGADSLFQQDIYSVGQKNIQAATTILHNMGLTIAKTDVRGNESRTLTMVVSSGLVTVQRQPLKLLV